jgi:hypothetical protein
LQKNDADAPVSEIFWIIFDKGVLIGITDNPGNPPGIDPVIFKLPSCGRSA